MTPELEKYVESHISPPPHELDAIDRLTNVRLLNGRMCSGRLQGRLLKMLTAMIRPHRVLELGTFSGYSALCIAEALEDGATLDTVEIDDELEDFIRANLASVPWGSRVTLHIGAAEQVAARWKPEEFDMVFLDADKRRYCEDFELVLPLVRPGGFILADNTLWGGHVVERTKHAAQTRGILDFNDLTATDPRVETVIVPLRDGLTLLRKLPAPAPGNNKHPDNVKE